VASAVGGIPEVVDDGTTGLLVTLEAGGPTEGEPRNPEQFSKDLAGAVNRLLDNPELRTSMARNARARVEQHFSWTSIARQTLDFYTRIIERHAAETSNGRFAA
jgi:glycosyltransferase involved in cell wall biosynthesis